MQWPARRPRADARFSVDRKQLALSHTPKLQKDNRTAQDPENCEASTKSKTDERSMKSLKLSGFKISL